MFLSNIFFIINNIIYHILLFPRLMLFFACTQLGISKVSAIQNTLHYLVF
jgi:hypothetical protein